MFNSPVKVYLLSCALLISLPLGAASETKPTDKLAIVNGKVITQQDYDDYFKRAKKAHAHSTNPKILLDELIQHELLQQDALKKKLDQHPEYISRLKEMKGRLLVAMAMHNYLLQNPLKEADLKQEYDQQVAQIKVPNEYQVRHILVKTEAEAETLMSELSNGKSFGEIAKAKSIDSASAKEGGELGWMTDSQVEPNFGKALATLKKGQYTTKPVETKYGWHIIQLDDIRTVALPTFESVKDQLQSALQGQQMQTYVESLREHGEITIFQKEVPNEP